MSKIIRNRWNFAIIHSSALTDTTTPFRGPADERAL
jgi:hypothetical protein